MITQFNTTMKPNHKTFSFTILLAALLFSKVAFGVVAYPYPIEYSLPDGSKLTIVLRGDEKVKWAETVDGYSILLNEKGFYEYAITNEYGDMVRSGVQVSNEMKRTSIESQLLSKMPKGIRFSKSQVSLMKQIWEINKSEAAKVFPTNGERKLICILIGFTDLPFTKTQADFNNLFNQVGYSAGGASGSVKDYYLENSYGQFNLTVDVAGPYTASQNMLYYGGNDASGNDLRPRELVREAIILANPDVNFADYDNDSNGYVDAVYIIYAGYGEEAGGGANAIWAHAWSLWPTETLDGKVISSYSCSAEHRGNSGTNITRIGVICHEFGHVLGAPDYYDTDYEDGGEFTGTGQWDMMAGGTWNNGGATPAHHNGFTKVIYYNWATVTELNSASTITLGNAVEHSNSFFRINT
ncbi:MAG: peptidase M6, partial [Bacteroidetes bacterium HGW-Bacteroidetes-15]